MDQNLEPWIFRLPDLHQFPAGSLPSPYGLMNPVRRLSAGLRLLAVGWLDGPFDFPKGTTDPDVVSILLGLDEAFLIDEGTAGYHSCYYCKPEDTETDDDGDDGYPWGHRPRSRSSQGHHLVRLGDDVYMCPALLPHYVTAHGYQPPAVFQDAVVRGTFLSDRDLIHTSEDFQEVALQQALAIADANGDEERAERCRAAIRARREELRSAGRTSGWCDPDTGVWRDR